MYRWLDTKAISNITRLTIWQLTAERGLIYSKCWHVIKEWRTSQQLHVGIRTGGKVREHLVDDGKCGKFLSNAPCITPRGKRVCGWTEGQRGRTGKTGLGQQLWHPEDFIWLIFEAQRDYPSHKKTEIQKNYTNSCSKTVFLLSHTVSVHLPLYLTTP